MRDGSSIKEDRESALRLREGEVGEEVEVQEGREGREGREGLMEEVRS